uniref:ANKLE2 third alpha/beta domain-containing protein n=1 Tax=Anopheles minimus TaxID=112268 RepID=A0A182W762_9DIPT
MEYHAIFAPNDPAGYALRCFYNDKREALGVLKRYKDGRMKTFSTSEEAVSFYLYGTSSEGAAPVAGTAAAAAPGSPRPATAERDVPKSPFSAPSSQKLVAFRKLIEANNIEEVRSMIMTNPRYLISSGDTPTILKEGPRYNALHITALTGRSEICRLILQTIENPSYIELLHGQRTSSTDEVTAILLDLYLNTPDKCRNETALHLAAKHGWVEVVKELIAFPQCQVLPNRDGWYPRDIICSRAKTENSTREIFDAIFALLKENFFVPVIRTEDNSLPPVVGEPFSPTELPRLDETKDKLNARREIKAYAGPMDQEKALRFCKRWKTPPRLMILGAAKIQSDSKLSELRKSSTPIKAAARRLFANRSFDGGRLEEEESGEQQEQQRNNNTLLDSSLDESLEQLEKLIPDDNGNHLRMSVPYTPNRLFFTYRNHLANDSIDTEDSYCGTDADAANFSYVCEETQTMYEKANVTESPSFKERSIRLTDPTKGLETVGRMLAEKEQVGWKEYWSFLGTFCNIADEAGLTMLEQYLAQKQQQTDGGNSLKTEESVTEGDGVPTCQKEEGGRSFNDVMSMICESTEKMSLNMCDELPRASVSNPYRCLLNSLHVFGTRLVNGVLLKPSAKSQLDGYDAAETFQTQIRQLEKLLENYRNDAAFRMIDFSKAHSLFAYLIVANVPPNRTTDETPSNVWKPLLGSGTMNETAKCVAKFLSHFADNPSTVTPIDFGEQTEWNSKTVWEDNVHILSCNCRTDVPTHATKGILERKNKRREKRAIRSPTTAEPNVHPSNVVVDFHTYRSASGADREPTPDGSFEEDERYYSCSDSEHEQEDAFFTPPSSPKAVRKDHNGNSDGKVEQLQQTTIAGIPNGLMELNDEEDNGNYTGFISGPLPTQDDVDVWNVLKMVKVDPVDHPHVYAWTCAMAKHHS